MVSHQQNKPKNKKKIVLCLAGLGIGVVTGTGYATTMGSMAASVASSFSSITHLITGGSYLAGLAFSIAAIMKFKQHKDNPTQIPVGTPVALVFIAASFLFLPSILSVAGYTMFGTAGKTSGPSGSVYS